MLEQWQVEPPMGLSDDPVLAQPLQGLIDD
jgi:hypothetical protein